MQRKEKRQTDLLAREPLSQTIVVGALGILENESMALMHSGLPYYPHRLEWGIFTL